MNCRNWPPFYEQNIDGKCVKVPPEEQKSSTLAEIGLIALVAAAVVLPFLLAVSWQGSSGYKISD
jgi:hypothetical protein